MDAASAALHVGPRNSRDRPVLSGSGDAGLIGVPARLEMGDLQDADCGLSGLRAGVVFRYEVGTVGHALLYG